MRESFKEKYCTNVDIPAHRLDFIDLKVKDFIELLNLEDFHWPIDCVKLIKHIEKTQLLPIEHHYVGMDDICDGVIEYHPWEPKYYMFINKNKGNYPFQCSNDRRLNFTVAHEIGHVVLGHKDIPDEAKTEEEKAIEELEADEFAGRFLMPSHLINTTNFYSLAKVAEYFLVSHSALWTRLNNLKRLTLLNCRTVRSCTCCGNTYFSMFGEYCGICGTPLSKGLNGMRQIYCFDGIPTDRYNRAIACPRCGREDILGVQCPTCKTYIFNFCSEYLEKGQEGCTNVGFGSHRYCEMCGKPSYFLVKRILKPLRFSAED